MRAVSFAGLHRLLTAVAAVPAGLRARDVNALVLDGGVQLTPRRPRPKPTTLYHYRNTLVRLGALVRDGLRLRANRDDPEVAALLGEPAPANGDHVVSHRLTVLHAPGGFGKTALLARCCRALRERRIAVAWLSLDEEDGPGSVALHLALAFEQAGVATFGPAGAWREGRLTEARDRRARSGADRRGDRREAHAAAACVAGGARRAGVLTGRAPPVKIQPSGQENVPSGTGSCAADQLRAGALSVKYGCMRYSEGVNA